MARNGKGLASRARVRPRASARRVSRAARASAAVVATYADFVIEGRRSSATAVELRVTASPAGALAAPVTVRYPADEARRLRESFRSGYGWTGALEPGTNAGTGRMLITQAEAVAIGRRLASVLFPPPVLRLFCESLAEVTRRSDGGLRVRLALDSSLVDLPWEYLHRPDRPASDGISAFLLLDPKVSLVRQSADPAIALTPIEGRQRLAFVGTLWEGGVDGWRVRSEYDLLCGALRPIARFLTPSFSVASKLDSFGDGAAAGKTAIFHYAGHVDFDNHARPYMVREMPQTSALDPDGQVYIEDLAPALRRAGTRLAVMSACNSGFGPAVKPLLEAGIPAVVAINGAVASESTIEFCAKLYDSLAVGLSLDEAVARARLHIMAWGQKQSPALFDWGLYMVYMPSPQSVLFPRAQTPNVAAHHARVEKEHAATVGTAIQMARELDGLNFGEIMSELSRRRVLILGRFSGRRLPVLQALKRRLIELPNGYQPELFTFDRPKSRDLEESIIGFAALSRFIIADLSEPRSVPAELSAIVQHFQSVPVLPVINAGGREYATFDSVRRRPNVVQPTLRYKNADDLVDQVERQGVPSAEAKLAAARPH